MLQCQLWALNPTLTQVCTYSPCHLRCYTLSRQHPLLSKIVPRTVKWLSLVRSTLSCSRPSSSPGPGSPPWFSLSAHPTVTRNQALVCCVSPHTLTPSHNRSPSGVPRNSASSKIELKEAGGAASHRGLPACVRPQVQSPASKQKMK